MKSFLSAFGLFGLIIFAAACLWNVFAQPAGSGRLRDLTDVRLATPPANGNALLYNTALAKWTNGAVAAGSGGTVGLADFNGNQFTTNGGTVSIKSGALQTNITAGTVTATGTLLVPSLLASPAAASNAYPIVHVDGATDFLEWPYLYYGSSNAFFTGNILLTGRTNVLSDNGTNLLRNGVPIATAGPTVTNTVVNNITNNSTVINSTTINSTTVNTTTNVFNVAKGGHLEISSNLTVLAIGPSKVVRTDANTNLAAVTIGTGLAFDGTNLTANGVGVYRDQSIEAGAMFAGPTAATTGTYTNTVNDTLSDSWTFADAATQSARFAITLPDVWNVGTVKLKLYVTCDGTNVATTTNLVWGVKAGSLAPLEALTNAVFGTQIFVTNGLNTVGNVLQVFTTPAITVGGSPATGDAIWFDVSRQGNNGSDTWTNVPVRLLKARVQWLESSTAPSSW